MKRFLAIGLIAIVSAVMFGKAAFADEVKVQIAGGYDEIEAFQDHEIVYASLSELAEIIGGTLSWETVGHKVVYHDASFRFEFLLGSPFCILDDTTLNMTHAAILRRGQLFVPAATFLPFLDRVTTQKLTWIPDRKIIRADSEYFNVTDMAVQAKANGLLIEIFLTTALAYEVFVTEGNWLNVSIRDARVNRNRILARREPRLMYSLKVHQVENNTGQISLRLKRNIEKWHHKLEHNPTRIQISISDVNFELDTSPTVSALGPDDKIDVIVIDPGHGGTDYGAIGTSGTREKDIALDLAKRLAKLIRKDKQFKVIMTRDRDRTVTLAERAEIANSAGADLFISLHANASPKRYVNGWNVFFLAPALNDTARAVEQLENSFFLRESVALNGSTGSHNSEPFEDPILTILNEMIMTEFQAESNDFAMMVDRELRRHLKTAARGVDQAGFFVLNKVFTPSVLVEAGFISNKSEERLLKDKRFQKKVAEGIYAAIKRFKSKFESR
jgi:N-acetylmuramoyl-L-alanine amidase